MGLYIRTMLARRRTRQRREGVHPPIGILLLALLLLSLLLLTVQRVRPKLSAYAVNQVQYEATTMMERAAADCTAELGSIRMVQSGTDGAVTSLTTNAVAVSQLRTAVVQHVYDEIGALESSRLSVPLGTLLDPQYLSGIGPAVPFGVTALGCVTADVESDFRAAGINQTIYTVALRVKADFAVQGLGKTDRVTVSAKYPLEETVVVGEVPMIAANSQ